MRPTWSIGLTDWQARCVENIEAGLLEYEAQQACLSIAIDRQQCKKWISLDKYPFGVRQNHPYDVWRQELKILDEFFALDVAFRNYKAWRKSYKKPRKSKCNERQESVSNENQLTLF